MFCGKDDEEKEGSDLETWDLTKVKNEREEGGKGREGNGSTHSRIVEREIDERDVVEVSKRALSLGRGA